MLLTADADFLFICKLKVEAVSVTCLSYREGLQVILSAANFIYSLLMGVVCRRLCGEIQILGHHTLLGIKRPSIIINTHAFCTLVKSIYPL